MNPFQVAGNIVGGAVNTLGTGYTAHTVLNSHNGQQLTVEYLPTTTTGIYSPSAAYSSSINWDGLLISFKGSGPFVAATVANTGQFFAFF